MSLIKPSERLISCGHFGKTVGLKGGIRLFPSSGQLDTLTQLKCLYLSEKQSLKVVSWQNRLDFAIVFFESMSSVDSVISLVNLKVYLDPGQLPKLSQGQYYWFELIGLEIVSLEGSLLGAVERIYSNGPQDILVSSKGHHIPFVRESIVHNVCWNKRQIAVDFNPIYFSEYQDA